MNKIKLSILVSYVIAVLLCIADLGWSAAFGPVPQIDYDLPNYANSPLPTLDINGNAVAGTGMRKFMDGLPGLGPTATNNLGQYIPIAVADTNAYPGSHYYEIAVVEYREKMHTDLATTKLRGYVQLETPANAGTSKHIALKYLSGSSILTTNGAQVFAYDNPHYLGPLIVAHKDVPTRIKFYNLLPIGATGDLFIPADTTVMGAGMGPLGMDVPPGMEMNYTQNRATLHLHGGDNPWISDGTPNQWTAPAGENTPYPKGVSSTDVSDMPIQPMGSLTFYWPNQQSGRLMFYHDHAYGITGPNVYAGEAAGYLLTDPTERALTSGATPGIPAMADVPLVIQDKTFVWGTPGTVNPDGTVTPGAGTWATDPFWAKHMPGSSTGDLWYPHIYMPNQDPTSPDGSSMMGRWDYGPWFWPVFPATAPMPELSHVPESFMDTPVINGTPYPVLTVDPKPYRFRILNACNDRMLNLQMYQANPGIVSAITVLDGGSGYIDPPAVTITGVGKGAVASAQIDANGVVTAVIVDIVGSGYTNPPAVTIAPPDVGVQATAAATVYTEPTEVGMVPSVPPQNIWPADWGLIDARNGGWPDPALRGPAFLQIGTEGGLLPKPAVLKNVPVDFDYNKRSITVLNVLEHTLWMGPAERADAIVDFSRFAGKTLILYNDCPAPVPAGDPRLDYYTCGPDLTESGGAPMTLPGYGPNTRTIMKIVVNGSGGSAPVNDVNTGIVAALQTALPAAFTNTLPMPIVPESAYNGLRYKYNGVVNGVAPDTYSRISNNVLSFVAYNTTTKTVMNLQPKCIQELFDIVYSRMNATLGVELPYTSAFIQTTIPFGFIDPPTEIFSDGETQIWKLTHNGVDTHAIHFHLFNVQLINRVGWDNMIKPPDANETGWKDTIKMNPLEDIIFAMRAKEPKLPFGVPQSVRPLDVTMPTNSTAGFAGIDPATGNPITVVNTVTNFDNEYVWHCHILGHEEYDMMRPMVVHPTVVFPAVPVLRGTQDVSGVYLAWTDGTPLSSPATLGNPANEIGFRIERADAVNGQLGAYAKIGSALANVTNYTDNSASTNAGYGYRVVAFNAAGDATSIPITFGNVANSLINLALASRGSTITGNNGASWSKLIDGITTGYGNLTGFGYTFWANAPNAPGRMTLDLKGVCTIHSINMLLWDLDARYSRYRIEASSNGTTWSTIVDRTAGQWSSWQTITLPAPIQARYLRLTGTFSSANNAFCVVEWEVYGTPPPPPNLALASRGSTITGNNGANWSKLIDGITTGYGNTTGFGHTFWANAPNAPGRMMLDLKRVSSIQSINMLLWDLDARYSQYRIEASSNGTTWNTIVDRTAGQWSGWQNIGFLTPIQARYLRLTGTFSSANNAFCVVEWEVHGY